MELSTRDAVLIGAAIVLIGLGVRYTMDKTGEDGTDSAGHAPLEENSAVSFGSFVTQAISAPVNMLGTGPNGLTDETKMVHFFDPDCRFHLARAAQGTVFLKHRYPTVTGTNISTLIHKGHSALMVPSRRDYDWMVNPPSESMFGA